MAQLFGSNLVLPQTQAPVKFERSFTSILSLMSFTVRRPPVLALIALVAAIAPAAVRSATPTQPHPASVLFTAPLKGLSGQRLTAVLLDFPPGQKSVAHHHAGDVYVYVLKGTVRLGLEGQPVQTLHEGESFFEPAGAHHIVAESASKTAGATALAVVVAPDGASLATVDK